MTTRYYIFEKASSRILGLAVCLIVLSSIFFGCKKFVEIPSPTTELVTASVFNNSATATAAMTSIYAQMANESYNRAYEGGLLSDEFTNYSSSMGYLQLYTNSMASTLQGTYGLWYYGNSYNYIYQANAVIAALQNNASITPAIRNQLKGEAEFIRAFWYFYLVNLYGDVPLATTISYTTNATLPRALKTQVYAQMIADLKDAEAKLSSNYVDASDTTVTQERVRPTKWAAAALLARVYLYTGNNWAKAEAQADTVINNSSLYTLEPDLNHVFLTGSREAIWQLETPGPFNGTNTVDGANFILISAPGGSPSQVALSPWLLAAFEANDQRKINWVGLYTDATVTPAVTYYFPNKYKVQYSTASAPTEYTMVLRVAEQYLIRAEARAQQGNLSGAAADLNMIRNRAGLANTTAGTQTALLAAILHERQVELFTEWQNRWFDLVRTGNANTVLGPPGNICRAKGGVWNSDGHQLLYPVPLPERQADPNVSQNPGY